MSAGTVRYDPFTFSHSQQVADIAAAIADELQPDSDAIRAVEIAAALHDIGEIALPPAALPRSGGLTRS